MVSKAQADSSHAQPPVGALLREWRTARRMSQLDLALEAGMSTRHLSCVETGRARASRELVCRLADVLGMPLRERNALLLAGGYAPQYQEHALATPALERMRQAIELIVAHQEPYPAFVIDRHWNVLMANGAAVQVNRLLMDGRESRHTNLLHQVFDPDDFRPVIVNWPEVAEKFIRHVHAQLAAAPTDQALQALLAEVLAYPGVPKQWRLRDLESAPAPVLTLQFQSRRGELRFFETITTFSMPRDVTLDELRIECAFPADDRTAAICTELAASG
ncbi:MAG TPA: helix-turn-helix transcriptional regulator [Rhodanobacter sp.]|nr:helix-turn-helix transcriptional regulator [Rhodanobacter sp.]